MPRECTICSSGHRDEIEDAYLAGTPKRRIASQYGVTERAVRYHLKEHLPELLALARDAERCARADSLLDRVEALQGRTEEALAKAEESDNLFATFRGISEMRRNLELIGEVTKELNRTPTLNLQLNAEWIEIRAEIMQALEDHSEAKRSVLKAIGGDSGGNA
jgi:predicted transcriptional regulator